MNIAMGRPPYRAWIVCMLALTGATSAMATGASQHDLVPIGRFAIDRHEVTIGQFRRFVEAKGIATAAEKSGGYRYVGGWQAMPGWSWSRPYGAPARDDEPAVHVTWHEAAAYCAWAGLRLPTDSEWVEAAYTERRAAPPAPFAVGKTYPYPTGDNPDAANQTASPRTHAISAPEGARERGRSHVPVRTTAPGVNGLFDMGGNVWEWVDHDVAGQKRTRGGSWWYGPAQMQASALYEKAPDFPAVYIGFRCAKSL